METARALVDSLIQEGFPANPRTFSLEDLLIGSPLGKYV